MTNHTGSEALPTSLKVPLVLQVAPTLKPEKYAEYNSVLQDLMQRKDVVEEAVARGLLNSVLQVSEGQWAQAFLL